MMESMLAEVAHYAGTLIEAMALVIIVVGSIEAFVAGTRAMVSKQATERERRAVWLRYGRWLVAGLTFQLAADLVHTSIAPTWDELGRLGAIAVIRTFLSYFLERDIDEMRERQPPPERRASSESPR
jgi:uncharacterized membrane protein